MSSYVNITGQAQGNFRRAQDHILFFIVYSLIFIFIYFIYFYF